MTHKSNNNSLRLEYSRLWTNVWSNNIEYKKLVVEDIRLDLLIRQFFRSLILEVLNFRIKRTDNFLFLNFIILIKFYGQEPHEYDEDEEKRPEKFKFINFLISFELRKIIRETCGHCNVIIFYRIIHFGAGIKKKNAIQHYIFKKF